MGASLPRPDGSFIFKRVHWKTTLFLNEKGNNHVWCSIEARLALRLWQEAPHRSANAVCEAAIRFPAYLSGLATILFVGILGRMAGNWRAGLAAAWLLAIHPWHLRYAVEMRGYSTNPLAVVFMSVFLIRALDDGRWRWWLAFGAAEVVALLSFAGSVYYPFAATVAALVVVARRRDWIGLGRCLVAQTLAGVVFLWFFGPSVPQIIVYMHKCSIDIGQRLTLSWYHDLWCGLISGAMWASGAVRWPDLLAGLPIVAWVFMSSLPVLLAAGAFFMAKEAGPS